jgi:hypothetical protein
MRSAFPILALSLLLIPFRAQEAPDFRLTDVSLGSPRRQTIVSPRDYIMQVSGYYFGAST